jgi:glycosyltransferase involved in cell wall biosynthesis
MRAAREFRESPVFISFVSAVRSRRRIAHRPADDFQMTAPLVSIITPTFNRPQYLPLLHRCVMAQDLQDFEWLVDDDSPSPSPYMQGLADKRISYVHGNARRAIGSKRNALVQRARGRIIAQFDDDDYYGSGYLARMVGLMHESGAAFAKLYGFFVYSKLLRLCGYWDLLQRTGRHMVFSKQPLSVVMLSEDDNTALGDVHLGYGFSYVFEKAVWEHARFPDIDWNEDLPFARQALERFRVVGVQDEACTSIHVLHESSTSRCFPQYLLPRFLLDRLFPGSKEHLEP